MTSPESMVALISLYIDTTLAFIRSFIYSFNNYVLSTNSLVVLSTGNITVDKTGNRDTVWVRGSGIKYDTYVNYVVYLIGINKAE